MFQRLTFRPLAQKNTELSKQIGFCGLWLSTATQSLHYALSREPDRLEKAFDRFLAGNILFISRDPDLFRPLLSAGFVPTSDFFRRLESVEGFCAKRRF